MDSEEYYEDYWEHREEIDHMYKDWIPERVSLAKSIVENHSPMSLLDVGCGEGILGKQLAGESARPSLLCGCDISETALQHADSYYDELIQLNVEQDSLDGFSTTTFDCVVCLETLEHLFNPSVALQHIYERVSDSGLFIASFPNFVYYKHRLDMLRGHVPEDYTLTDDAAEHIQNFTLESFTALLEDAGFSIKSISPVIKLPVSLLRPFCTHFPQVFASQYVISASP